ncbi:MAG: helicase-exonuclease AddAB subunit AddA [Bacillota bacterium]|nr:helicase-exonuclease AddAB subunit AddA [Bacillota bacterium]
MEKKSWKRAVKEMPKWTDEQKTAINERGCDLLVSAAAGSGKTAVLSERVLRRISDPERPVSVDRLLIVTFTNAAAAEMRQRIIDKLREELEKYPENIILSKQLTLAPRANITTIHSFCLNVIKSNFHLLDIDPSFGILDEGEKEIICLQLAQEVINEMYDKHGEKYSHMALWLADGKDEQLAEEIIELYKYIQSFGDPLAWLHEQVEKYNITDFDMDSLEWTDILKEKYKNETAMCLDMLKEAEKLSVDGEADGYIETIAEDFKIVEAMVAALAGTWQEVYKAAKECNFNPIKRNKNKDCLFKEEIMALREKIKKKCKATAGEIIKIEEGEAAASLLKAYPLFLLLEESIQLFTDKYMSAKKEKNVLDFNDFEHVALSLLNDENLPVSQELRNKFDEIYVDEYQDCNDVQECIFSAIARRSGGKSCNMFMVGDVKQSIYKFRQADPGIFIGKLERYGSDGIQKKIMLNKNFRSRPQIVDCINNLFRKIMSREIGNIEYGAEEELNAGFDYPEYTEHENGGSPELLGVMWDEDIENEIEYEEEVSEEDIPETKEELEARLVACKIRGMIGNFYVYDRTIEGYRPSTYKDFAILIRSSGRQNGRIEAIEAELKALDIPYFSDKGGGLFDALETELLMSALNVTDNPLQDIPLIGLMRSALIGFDEDELLRIRKYKSNCNFYGAVALCSKDDSELGGKCMKFLSMLKEWRNFAKAAKITELIGKIIEDTSFYAYIQTLSGGRNRRANIELFIEYGRQFENADLHGVFAFVKYIEKMKGTRNTETAKILSEACDVVRIMTIHKSKGLEFPVVFLMFAGGGISNKDWAKKKLLIHKRYGIGCNFVDAEKHIKYPLITKMAVSRKIKTEGLSEEMRVLYVALTRAREKLFVTVSGKKAGEKIENAKSRAESGHAKLYEVENAKSYLDWLLLAMNGAGEGSDWKTEIISAAQLALRYKNALESLKVKEKENEAGGEYAEVVNRQLSYEYPHRAALSLSAKYSVTEIKHRFNAKEDGGEKVVSKKEELLPGFMRGEKFTPSFVGTVYHLILRFADFSLTPDEAVKECRAMLVDKGFLSESELEPIDNAILINFMNSEIYDKMKGSNVIYREIPFNISVSGDTLTGDDRLKDEKALLQGIIDCLFVIGDKCYVVDYKMEGSRYTDDELVEMYRKQIELYTVAAEKITGKPIGGRYLYFLGRGRLCEL